ncbi:MAG: 30S ribosomal protein S18 [Spirochaetes bacterium]|nr:30S ribosomal protein S18 [Spirochaetota bacterium]
MLKEVNVDAKSRQQTEKEEGDALKKVTRFKRKTCRFCANKDLVIDYKNVELLSKFITDRGKILPRRITGNCAKHQRIVAQQIKRARIIALLPFVVK